MDTPDGKKKRRQKSVDEPAPDAGAAEARELETKRRRKREEAPEDDALLDDAPAAPMPVRSAPADALAEFFYRPDETSDELLDFSTAEEGGADSAEDEAPVEYLAFLLAGEEYAVRLDSVREIVKAPVITEVPRAPQDVKGVMSLRGDVVPVFEVRRRLGLPVPQDEPSRSARIVIVDVGEGPVGVLVDAVDQVVRLRPSTIEATPHGLGGGAEAEYLAGIGRQKDRFFILLNLPALLARPTLASRERR